MYTKTHTYFSQCHYRITWFEARKKVGSRQKREKQKKHILKSGKRKRNPENDLILLYYWQNVKNVKRCIYGALVLSKC